MSYTMSEAKAHYIEERATFQCSARHRAAISGLICAYAATSDRSKLDEAYYFQSSILLQLRLLGTKTYEAVLEPYFNLKDKKGRNPLFVAVDYKQYGVIYELFKMGCDPMDTYNGDNLWEYLFKDGGVVECDRNIVSMCLLGIGGQDLRCDGMTPAELFIETCSLELVPAAYRRDWIIQTDRYGRSPLQVAVDLDEHDYFIWLLNHGADLKQRTNGLDIPTYLIELENLNFFPYILPNICLPKIGVGKLGKIAEDHPFALVIQKDLVGMFKLIRSIKGVSGFTSVYQQSAVSLAMQFNARKILLDMQTVWPYFNKRIERFLNPPKPKSKASSKENKKPMPIELTSVLLGCAQEAATSPMSSGSSGSPKSPIPGA